MRNAFISISIAVIVVLSLFSCTQALQYQMPDTSTTGVEEEVADTGSSDTDSGIVGVFIPALSPLLADFYYDAMSVYPATEIDRDVQSSAYIFSPQATFTVTDTNGDTVDYWEYYSAGLELSEGNYAADRDIPIGRDYTLSVEIFNDKVSLDTPVVVGSTQFSVLGGARSEVSLQLVPNPSSPAYTNALSPGNTHSVTMTSATYDSVENRVTDFAAEWWYKIDTIPGQADPATGKAVEFTVAPTDTATVAFFAVFNAASEVVSVGSSDVAGGTVSRIFQIVSGETYYVGVFPINDGTDSVLDVSYQVLDNTPPTPTFQITPLVPEVGDTVTFDASASTDPDGDSIASYSWDFGDGTTATGAGVTHAYTASAVYHVVLTVTDSNGEPNSIEQIVIVDEPANRAPTAVIVGDSVVEATQGDTVAFDASDSYDPDSGDVLTYSWDFDGDGTDEVTDDTSATASHTYTAGAGYRARLTVKDQDGAQSVDYVTIMVNAVPVAGIASPPSGTQVYTNQSVVLDGTISSDSDGSVASWDWTLTDSSGHAVGTVSGAQAITSFSDPDTYTVDLTVTDNEGAQSAPATITILVPNQAPEVDAGDNLYVDAGTSAFLQSIASDPDGGTLTYGWEISQTKDSTGAVLDPPVDFDANTSSEFSTSTFTESGTYKATLVVTDPLGATAQDSLNIIVPVVDPVAPDAEFTPPTDEDPEVMEAIAALGGGSPSSSASYYDPTEGRIYSLPGRLISFDVSKSYDPDGLSTGALTYEWDFDYDGSTPAYDITEQTGMRSWQYDVTGDYVVYVNITDDDTTPLNASLTIDVSILPPPNQAPIADAGTNQTVEVVFDPVTTIIDPATVTFDGSGSYDPDADGALTYSWDFGDGSTPGTGATPSHSYNAAGVYLVTLTVTDANSLAKSDTDTMAVTVKRQTINYPPVAVAPADVTVVSGEPFELDGSGSYDPDGQIAEYTWSIDGTPIVSGPGVAVLDHVISTAGTYQAVLEVTDGQGVSSTSSPVTIEIQEPPPLSFVFNVAYGGTLAFDKDHPLILAVVDRRYATWANRDPVLVQEISKTGRYVMHLSDMSPTYDPDDGRYALAIVHDLDGTGSPETNYWGFLDSLSTDGFSTDAGSYTLLQENGELISAGEPEYSVVFTDTNSGTLDLTIR